MGRLKFFLFHYISHLTKLCLYLSLSLLVLLGCDRGSSKKSAPQSSNHSSEATSEEDSLLKEKVDTIGDNVEQLNETVTGINSSVETLGDEVTALSAEVAETRNNINGLSGELDAVDRSVQAVRDDVNNLKLSVAGEETAPPDVASATEEGSPESESAAVAVAPSEVVNPEDQTLFERVADETSEWYEDAEETVTNTWDTVTNNLEALIEDSKYEVNDALFYDDLDITKDDIDQRFARLPLFQEGSDVSKSTLMLAAFLSLPEITSESDTTMTEKELSELKENMGTEELAELEAEEDNIEVVEEEAVVEEPVDVEARDRRYANEIADDIVNSDLDAVTLKMFEMKSVVSQLKENGTYTPEDALRVSKIDEALHQQIDSNSAWTGIERGAMYAAITGGVIVLVGGMPTPSALRRISSEAWGLIKHTDKGLTLAQRSHRLSWQKAIDEGVNTGNWTQYDKLATRGGPVPQFEGKFLELVSKRAEATNQIGKLNSVLGRHSQLKKLTGNPLQSYNALKAGDVAGANYYIEMVEQLSGVQRANGLKVFPLESTSDVSGFVSTPEKVGFIRTQLTHLSNKIKYLRSKGTSEATPQATPTPQVAVETLPFKKTSYEGLEVLATNTADGGRVTLKLSLKGPEGEDVTKFVGITGPNPNLTPEIGGSMAELGRSAKDVGKGLVDKMHMTQIVRSLNHRADQAVSLMGPNGVISTPLVLQQISNQKLKLAQYMGATIGGVVLADATDGVFFDGRSNEKPELIFSFLEELKKDDFSQKL